MAWEHLSITKAHLVYIILGGFTSIFMLCSSVIKERLYIGEATVATLCGIIFGPHAANLIDPGTWGNTDLITLEFSRIVLVVQCFAVGVELPKSYMERHWRSVTFLLVPVMTFGWLITSLFIWWMFGERMNWLDSLCCAACVTATDPVLASSVVGKGKFAKRVPKHLRDLLSAESGCNDGMAFPFIYLAIYLIRYRPNANEVAFHWICYTILYECIFGAFYGVCVGYAARRAIRFAHDRDLVDRESFLVFYFVLALFCAGSGSMLGMDDLLIGFACGVGFSNDGWFQEKTEESHVSNVIDLLINLAFFVYFGTIIPWEQFNSDIIGTTPWRLVVVALFVLFFRRIPIMVALKPVIPDIKTWREASFAGHFGPIGVGAIFVAILARAELENETTTPLAELPPPDFEHANIIELIWPITTFLVITSIIVHGSSIAVFTLGKHINTLTISLSYTQANEEGPSWMERLPRIQSRSKSSMSLGRPGDEESAFDEKLDSPDAAMGLRGQFLRRQKEEDTGSRSSSLKPPFRRKRWEASGLGPGGPISQSAITPQPRQDNADRSDVPDSAPTPSDTLAVSSDDSSPARKKGEVQEPEEEIYQEGDQDVIEDEEGNVLEVRDASGETDQVREKRGREHALKLMDSEQIEHGVAQKEQDTHVDEGEKFVDKAKKGAEELKDDVEHPSHAWKDVRKRMQSFSGGLRKREVTDAAEKKSGAAMAYQYGNTIVVEDEDGEVIKKYDIPNPKAQADRKASFADPMRTRERLNKMGSYIGWKPPAEAGPSTAEERNKQHQKDEEDDARIRFTAAGGRRMSKAEFIQQIKGMDPRSRAEFVEKSDVPQAVKREARKDLQEHADNKKRATEAAAEEFPFPNQENPKGPKDPKDDTGPGVKKVADKDHPKTGPEGLALIDSNEEEIPFHSVTEDLASYDFTRGSETAAQRRRRLASRSPPREGADDDVAPDKPSPESSRQSPARQTAIDPRTVVNTSDRSDTISRHTSALDEGETAAERRRREGALGLTQEVEEESDEDEDEPNSSGMRHLPPHAQGAGSAATRTPGIRFADHTPPSRARTEERAEEPAQQSGPSRAQNTGRSRLRWATDLGRKKK